MIITKEQQEAWVDKYIKEKHTQDECIGFIDGIKKVMDTISTTDLTENSEDSNNPTLKFLSDENRALKQRNEKLLEVVNEFLYNWDALGNSNDYSHTATKAREALSDNTPIQETGGFAE